MSQPPTGYYASSKRTYGRSSRSSQTPNTPRPARAPFGLGNGCSIKWEPAVGAYRISATYNEGFIAFIKSQVPGTRRSLDVTTEPKSWLVEPEFFDGLKAAAETIFGAQNCEFSTKEEVEKLEAEHAIAQRAALLAALPEKERAMMEFFEVLPFDAMQAAYRKAALMLHPDRNANDGNKMSILNTAWAKLEKEFSKK